MSRRRAILITVAALGLLDFGRSLYARLGAAQPTRRWRADPAYAQAIAWPPGSDLPPGAPPGQRIYAQHCAICHGPEGHGNGPAAPSLHPRPRDFSSGVFKLKSTPGSEPPTLADVQRTIRDGMPGSSMPAWGDLLTDSEIAAVGEYTRELGPLAQWSAADRALAAPSAVLAAASAEHGRELYVSLGCPVCHGQHGKGDGTAAPALKDVWKQADPPRDLTAPWTFRGGNAPEALYRRIACGISGTPMPSYADATGPADIAAVVAYVRSIARRPAWETGGALAGPGQSADPVRRGAYLVRAGMCGLCHTPVDPDGIYLADTHYLAGGMKVAAGAHGFFFAANLTPDVGTGLGAWTVEQIATAIRTGHTPTRRLNYWGMPWMVLGALTSEDATAIATYLKTLPPVRNQVPLPLRFGVVETVARKLAYGWPALVPERLAYFPGDFGYAHPTRWSRDLPQRLLIWAQLAVLVVGALAWRRAPRRRVRHEGPARGLRVVFGVLGLVGCAAAVIVDRYPALNSLPSETVINAFAAAIPPAKTEGRSAREAALLRRGRYLYGIASCPYCHNGDGAGGGKVNWSPFGTTWARNLTAHPSGLADWPDEAVLRAMAGGVSRDGRPLHWQAMIWDYVSNYAPEDQRALLAYMRTLPAVQRRLPPPAPPAAGDCSGDTFWIGVTNWDPGCR